MSCRACLKVLLCLLGISCSDKEPGAPIPTEVRPSEGENNKPTSVIILGQNFQPLIMADYNDKQKAIVSTAFKVMLDTVLLTNTFEPDDKKCASSVSCLLATVPAGLAPGIYTLEVTDPRGRSGELKAAFTVKGTPADSGPDSGRDAGLDLTTDAPKADLKKDTLNSDKDTLNSDKDPGPLVSTVAGSGIQGLKDAPVSSAQFFNPRGVVATGSKVYIGDYENHAIRLIENGAVTTIAGTGINGKNNGPVATASFNYPVGLALNSTGTIFVADSSNDMIRQIKSGFVSTLAGSGIKGFQNGTAATARFNYPLDVAVSDGLVYVADSENHRIRKISAGVVSTFAGSGIKGFQDGASSIARFSSPSGIAVLGNDVYVADTGNNRIRLIRNGQVTTVAGEGVKGSTDGPASSARFWNPVDLVVTGNKVFVVDQSNHRIRLIQNEHVSTLSGSYFGYKNGPIKDALFYFPFGIALGSGNTLYVADQSNHRIRLVPF